MATIPPWIVTPDAAGQYTRGFGLGLDVAQKRAAMAVQQQQMALQAQSMEQARQTAAENAARQAIALQMEQQFRSAKLAADANALAQSKQLADAARTQAATLAGNELESREKIAAMQYGPRAGVPTKEGVTVFSDPNNPKRTVGYGIAFGGDTVVFKADDAPEDSLRKRAIADSIKSDATIPYDRKIEELTKLFGTEPDKGSTNGVAAVIEWGPNRVMRFKR